MDSFWQGGHYTINCRKWQQGEPAGAVKCDILAMMDAKTATMAGLLVACMGCSGVGPFGSASEQTSLNQRNAEILALCISGDIFVPPQLCKDIEEELHEIYGVLDDTDPKLRDISVVDPWGPFLWVRFSESAYESVLSGEYSGWDGLNRQYNVVRKEPWDLGPVMKLWFAGTMNLCSVGLVYQQLAEVEETVVVGVIGESPTIFAREEDGRREYLFFWGIGECPLGCVYREYTYVRIAADGAPELIGVWTTGDPKPVWWSSASSMIYSCSCRLPVRQRD